MVFTYIIKGQQDFHYCGITAHMCQRFKQHNTGHSISTRQYKPFVIVFTAIHSDYKSARKMEVRIKSQGVKNWYLRNVRWTGNY